ncbi:MAG TPA: septum formation initiator family protein [Myxococcota bacterium]|jgi:cell division protein FtsB
MRARGILAVAAGLGLAIAAYAVLSPTGLPQLWHMQEQEKSLTVDVDKARADNAKLSAEVKVLQGSEPSSRAVLEKHAREELGYIKADEVVLTTSAAPAPGTAAP